MRSKVFLRAGMLAALAVVVAAVPAKAKAQMTTIHSFTGANGDGEYPYPYGKLPFDNNGALYGTTAGGGTNYNGTVYQLVPRSGGGWTENVLYEFQGGADGRQPGMGVVFDSLGNLYGSTQFGGNEQVCGGGCGTIFELSPPMQQGGQWTHTVIYTFQGNVDGQYPGELLFGANGVLYGTTTSGGANPGVPCHTNRRITYGCGTVFTLTESKGIWSKDVIYTFPQFKGDGTTPGSEITFDSQGNLYGVTSGGTYGYGTAFQLAPNGKGWTETVLHEFTGGADGGYPAGTITVGANGVLYGVGSYSGVANASGVVYELTESGGVWAETVLHTFPAFKGDATTPFSTMAIDQNGNLYGTSVGGGSTACYEGCGTIFKLAPPSGGGGWTDTILVDLGNSGQNPNSSIVTYHNGLLHGTTTNLGASDVGSVFTLVPQAKKQPESLHTKDDKNDGEPNIRLRRASTFYPKFSRSIDAKILGRKTFDLSTKMSANFKVDDVHYVFSRRPTPASVPAGVQFVTESLRAFAAPPQATWQEHLGDGRR